MPDYSIPAISNKIISTGLSGLAGVFITFILAHGIAKTLKFSMQT